MGNFIPGIGLPTGTPYEFKCDNAHITKIAGRSGARIDGISFECSDGKKSDWYGGQGGSPWVEESLSGFIGLEGAGDEYVDRLQFLADGGVKLQSHGGPGGKLSPAATCGPGAKINGAKGGYGEYLNGVQFICSEPTGPIVSPDGTMVTVLQPMTTPETTPATATTPATTPVSTPATIPAATTTPVPAPVPAPVVVSPAAAPPNNFLYIIGGILLFVIFAVIASFIIMYKLGGRQPPA
jgi:hypothetical protein